MKPIGDVTESRVQAGVPHASSMLVRAITAAVIAAVALQGCAVEPNEGEEEFAAVQPGATRAVIDWNAHAENALFVVAAQPPYIASLGVAMTQAAVYDAVNAIGRSRFQPFLAAPQAMHWYSAEAAAATAAYRVLVNLVPEQRSVLLKHYEEALAANAHGPAAKAGGIQVGEQAAATLLAARENDGRGEALSWVTGNEKGEWRPTPPGFVLPSTAWVGTMKPFMIPSAAALRSEGPAQLTSHAYATDLNEVKEVGSKSSTTRTQDQTDAALFWHFGGWGNIVRSLAERRGLSTADTARLFAMESLAAADAAIACFNDKYHWSFWRPVTAIHEAASDGNPATSQDPSWAPLVDTPPFPEHPSGHSCSSGAVARVLQDFFGRDRMAFSGTSGSVTRNYTSFSQASEEVINARVWSGVHFRTADVQGVAIGEKAADYMKSHFFQRK